MKHTVTLANGAVVPALGQGTWYLGENRAQRQQEIEGIHLIAIKGILLKGGREDHPRTGVS